ncbi:hypothetical protein ACQ4PT_025566 [Festuca glaucescens]
MEVTALSVGKSVLNGALSYAKSALAEEVALQLGVRRDHLFITNELEMMQAFLESAHDEGDDNNRVVKVWVKQVRDVAYDVEDTLQEFSVRLEKKSWWRIRRTLLDRRRVAKQMKELRANVEDVSQRNTRYNLIKGSSSKPATIGGQSAIAGATVMSGNDEARRQLEKAKDDLFQLIRNRDDHLRVIAVWGTSSDLRRTSIIERVFADVKKHSVFDCHAWITLTRPFNSTEFLRSIIRQFYVNFLQESERKEKGSQDGTESTKAGSSSNVGTDVSDSSDNMKMLNRTETTPVALKESQLIGRETEKAEIINELQVGIANVK